MRIAVRPYVMSGIAVVAAGAVAAAPVSVERAAVEAVSPLVQLTAAPTPADIYDRLLADTTANLEALIAAQLANPSPVLRQLITDPVTSIQNAPGLAGQLPGFLIVSGLSVVGPPAAAAAAGVVSAQYTLAALGSGDPAQVLQAAAAAPAFAAYGLLNGGWGPDLEPTNPDLYLLAGGLLSEVQYAFIPPGSLFIQIPGPVGAVQYVQKNVADTLAGMVVTTAAKQDAPATLQQDPVDDVSAPPKQQKRRGVLLSNAVARIGGALDTLRDGAAPRLTKAGGTDLADGNLAAAPAGTRPGQRIRSAVKEVRQQLRSAVKKLQDSVGTAVGVGNTTEADDAE